MANSRRVPPYMKRQASGSRTAPPEMWAAGVANPQRPQTDWIEWDKQDTILHLTHEKTVKLRMGDQILVSPGGEHGITIHGYRPRIEH